MGAAAQRRRTRFLSELELDGAPRLVIFNKSDRMVPEAAEQDAIYVSARTKEGLPALRAAIRARLATIKDAPKA